MGKHLEQLTRPEPIFSVAPNAKNIIFENFMAVIIALFVIIIFFLFVYWQIGFVSFDLIGLIIQPVFVVLIFILGVVIVSLLVLLVNYLFTGKFKYDFYKDKLVIYKKYFLKPEKCDEVFFRDIQRIQIKQQKDNSGSGKVILDLKESSVELESLTHVEEVEFKFRNLLQEFMVIQPLRKSERAMKNLRKQAEEL